MSGIQYLVVRKSDFDRAVRKMDQKAVLSRFRDVKLPELFLVVIDVPGGHENSSIGIEDAFRRGNGTIDTIDWSQPIVFDPVDNIWYIEDYKNEESHSRFLLFQSLFLKIGKHREELEREQRDLKISKIFSVSEQEYVCVASHFDWHLIGLILKY